MESRKPVRKQLERREVPDGIRFVAFSCHHRLPLLDDPAIRDILVHALAAARDRFRFDLFAWVIMPEHVHLLMRPPRGTPLDRILLAIKLAVSMRALARWREIGSPILRDITLPNGTLRFWQKGGGFDRNTRDREEFTKSVQYIHRNPVKRGLVERPEDWQWSSVRWWMGRRDGEIPCDPPPGGTVDWKHWGGFV